MAGAKIWGISQGFWRISLAFQQFATSLLCYKKDCFKKLAEWLDRGPAEERDLKLKFYACNTGTVNDSTILKNNIYFLIIKV